MAKQAAGNLVIDFWGIIVVVLHVASLNVATTKVL